MSIPMPEYKGSFFGQTRWTTVKVKMGKKIPIDTEEGDKIFIPVKTPVEKYLWTWDGKRWLNPAQWDALIRKMHRNSKHR